jgi:hypothetical protein
MELTIEIPEKDLLAYGLESVQREISHTLRWMKIRQSFQKISLGLKAIPEPDYLRELEAIRAEAWKEYHT